MSLVFNFSVKENGSFTKSDFENKSDYKAMMKNFFTSYLYNIVTHSGVFHADDVFAVALTLLVRECYISTYFDKHGKITWDKIYSSVHRFQQIDDESVYNTALCLDLLNGHFDHHMKNDDRAWFGDQETGHYIASVGALWDSVGHMFNIELNNPNMIDFNVKEKIYKDFLEIIDLADLFGPKAYSSPISKMISNINSYTELDFDFVNIEAVQFETAEEKQMARFVEAVCLAYKILKSEIARTQKFIESFNEISENEYVELIENEKGLNYLLIKQVPEGIKEPQIPLESLSYILNKGKRVDALVNMNPNIRDGSFRIVASDSSRCKFEQNCCQAKGVHFFHPQQFMITFMNCNDLKNFVEKLGLVDDKSLMII
jgi:uncharacterized UPF0160 family protein